MKRFWISWYQKTEDHRPLTFPPNKAILGWWCSGYDADDNAIICAVVEAESLTMGWKAVDLDWPRMERTERFAEEIEGWKVPGDRFPLSDWMRERFAIQEAK